MHSFTCFPAGLRRDLCRSWRSLVSVGAAETLLTASARDRSASAHWIRMESIFERLIWWKIKRRVMRRVAQF